jgi:hypothetical protein
MKLIATKSMRFAGRSLNVGDEFEASEKNGKLLKAIKKADEAPRKVKSSRKADDPEAVTEPSQGAGEKSPSAKYLTRVMTAKD